MSHFNEKGLREPGSSIQGVMRPLPIKKGSREVDCRIRLVPSAGGKSEEDNGKDDNNIPDYLTLEVLEAKHSDATVRGRDWLEDFENTSGDRKVVERRFEFGMVKETTTADGEEERWVALPPTSRDKLNAQLSKLRAIALEIRRSDAAWRSQGHEKIKSAEKKVAHFARDFRVRVDREMLALREHAAAAAVSAADPAHPVVVDISSVCAAMVQGRAMVEKAKMELVRLKEAGDAFPDKRRKLFERLTEEQVLLKNLGDALDVNAMELPLVWTSNIDWMLTSWREVATIVT